MKQFFLNTKFENIEKKFLSIEEIQPSHRRIFDKRYVKNGEVQDVKKTLRNNVIKQNKVKYIFVSNYFYNEICED